MFNKKMSGKSQFGTKNTAKVDIDTPNFIYGDVGGLCVAV